MSSIHQCSEISTRGFVQELVLFWVQPAVVWGLGLDSDSESLHSQGEIDRDHEEMQESQAACRRQFGLSFRRAVSQLPRLTSLELSHVSFEEPGSDIVSLHPYSQLE